MTWRRCPSNQSVTLARAGSGPALTLHPARSAIVGVHGAADLDHVLAEHQVQVAVTEVEVRSSSSRRTASPEAVIQVHGEVAGLLHRPCRGRSGGRAR
jgi:hypothetical protein